jgi:alpha,alpha-trehalase
MVLNRYNGTFPSTFIDSGLQWDAPNTWPPHQYIVLQALRNLPSNVTSGPLPTPGEGQSTYNLVPAGQLGLTEDKLPGQPVSFDGTSVKNSTQTGAAADLNKLAGTVANGGTAVNGEGWAAALQRELANRYFASAYCSWYATGGSIPDKVPRLSDQELNITHSLNSNGHMFEKFSNLDIDSAGRGGEYTVQAGFGWTNGVALWLASNYGGQLDKPSCPSIMDSFGANAAGSSNDAASLTATPRGMAMLLIGAMVLLLL